MPEVAGSPELPVIPNLTELVSVRTIPTSPAKVEFPEPSIVKRGKSFVDIITESFSLFIFVKKFDL